MRTGRVVCTLVYILNDPQTEIIFYFFSNTPHTVIPWTEAEEEKIFECNYGSAWNWTSLLLRGKEIFEATWGNKSVIIK